MKFIIINLTLSIFSGMDPKARRNLWDTLNKIRDKGKSLILTTHR